MKNNTINKKEIEKFSLIAEEWWNPEGKFKPLHKFNPIRISYIKENIIKTFKNSQKKTPLKNIKILDIGCGRANIISFLQKRRFNISIWKVVTVSPLLFLTVVWSKDAIIMFVNQAESTEVQIRRGPLSLPFITVCPYTQFASWMDLHFPCGQSESEFMQAVQKCLPSEPDLVDTILEEFLDQSLKYGPKSLVLVTKKESFIMENKDITTVFHNVFGPCYTYNTHGWQDKILECSHNYSSEACSNWKLEIHYPHVSGNIYKIFVPEAPRPFLIK